jgi:ATP-dependent DNA helicase RecG
MEGATPLSKVLRLSEDQKKALTRLNLNTVEDLLYHFPARYSQYVESSNIAEAPLGEKGSWYGVILDLKLGSTFKRHLRKAEGSLETVNGKVRLIWFNQPYLAKMFKEGDTVRVSGKLQEYNGARSISNPEIETVPELPPEEKGSLFGKKSNEYFAFPIYPESRGITSRFFYHHIQKILKSGVVDTLHDPIPTDILETYNLPTLKTALIWVHSPKKEKDAEVARKRFAFEQVFYIQLQKQKDRQLYEQSSGFKLDAPKAVIDTFLTRFPFSPTNAQKNAIANILTDMKSGNPMSRLLEGDVGSGKTAVAATTAYAVVAGVPEKDSRLSRLQVAYMAPTELLATQHFESFIEYFKHLPINIGLLTGSGCRKFPSKVDPSGHTAVSRAQLLKWVKEGDISILIGTHALIQKSVHFKNLAYIIIDEQHRFGVKQRKELTRKDDRLPHLLSMTATPIPRTLALTIFGDLDITLLDEMPAGRKKIDTRIVPPTKRKEMYDHIKRELKEGRQAYIICPRIDEPDPEKELAIQAKSVKAEAIRLKRDIFPEARIEIQHSKMKPKEKDEIMIAFKAHKIDILVATSVVEVGVNVPNATNIVIEGAERFGLAQLHQLRGRVIRSNHQAYCFLLSESAGDKTMERLKALVEAENGFKLAELDLTMRGTGGLLDSKQWGMSDIAMEAIKNIKMVEAARTEASRIIKTDPDLTNYPALKATLTQKLTHLHFE